MSAIRGPSKTPRLRLRSPGQRVNVSGAFGRRASAALEDSWADIDDEVDRNPDAHGEIPVEAVVTRVAECLDRHLLEVEEERQPDGVEDVEQQERRMEADDGPGRAAIRRRVPSRVERPQIP